MEPPSCTVVLSVVRTTTAVVTELSPPEDVAVLLLPLVDATATAPATVPPTNVPVMAAMATTRRAENSAIGSRNGSGSRPAVARQPGAGHHDVTRRTGAGDPPRGGIDLLGAHFVGVLDQRA